MASALPKVNWTQLTAPLRSETVAAIAAVRGRNVELFKQIETLQAQDSSIDFSAFRSSIADSKIVDQAEQAFKSFKPKSYDITAQLNELKKGEELALKSARENAGKVQDDFTAMKKLWSDIDNTLPVDELVVSDIEKAYPDFDKTFDKLLRRGQWRIPGYYEKFGEFHVGF